MANHGMGDGSGEDRRGPAEVVRKEKRCQAQGDLLLACAGSDVVSNSQAAPSISITKPLTLLSRRKKKVEKQLSLQHPQPRSDHSCLFTLP